MLNVQLKSLYYNTQIAKIESNVAYMKKEEFISREVAAMVNKTQLH